MIIRVIVFFWILLFALPLFARENTDVIVMKNGDHLTCEIKGLSAGVLSVKLKYAQGTIGLEWAQVAHLESNQLFLIPPPTLSGSDYGTSSGLSWTFGNR
jgi:hypothetical protein